MKGTFIWQQTTFAALLLPCQLGFAAVYKALNPISYDNLVLSSVIASVGGVLLALLTSFVVVSVVKFITNIETA
ncbi:hypothetical protein VA249_45910 (plasmid) [Vibrio alfacsensis]|uniref:hypothetical protein n=1 Tax=Vibrio alfacsensis TaxID=1074311 RepID=UPI001BF07CE4|nr:hypothetical protein [Vibrio alfacsensis]BBM67945.1 hypothetical protein VA249_45910 [Vibrio alfacsensis]